VKEALVNIAMVTFNQERYIAQAIESVLAQETNFPYRLIIADDCSKDSTDEICRAYAVKYPSKISLTKNLVNLGLVINYKKVFDLCNAKYIAILEGDDYWTDQLKLQKQVDILESDNKIGLVHTDHDTLHEDNKILYSTRKVHRVKIKNGYVFNYLIKKNFIASVTTCFRKELFDRYVDYDLFIKEKLVTIDYSIWMELSYHSKVYYIEESTAVYRVLKTSITNSSEFGEKETYYNSGRKIKKYFFRKYLPPNYTTYEIDKAYDFGLLIWAIKFGQAKKAREYFRKVRDNSIFLFVLAPAVNHKLTFKIFSYILKLKKEIQHKYMNRYDRKKDL